MTYRSFRHEIIKQASKQASKLLLGVALTFALINSANAIPVDWTMTDATLNYTTAKTRTTPSIDVVDNISFSFTYDADTNLFTNVSLVSSYYGNGNSVSNSNLQNTNLVKFGFDVYTNKIAYNIDFAGVNPFPLTNAGGTSAAIIKYDGLYNPRASVTFTGTPQATAVPEPEAYAMMLAGLGLVGFAARRNKQAA